MKIMKKLQFASDYQEGAHPNIINRLVQTNMDQTPGYGTDAICASARKRIQEACQCDASVYFLSGGTQTNATIIGAILSSYQGVIAPTSGHVSVHEAGAIEFGGHKVLSIPSTLGKITAQQIEQYMQDFEHDLNHEHMVMPGMVYLSQPTEYGTLYSKAELSAIYSVCKKYSMPLYIDGARLAYALASQQNDISLPELAQLCDIFYIGGTKCGALIGEAVVMPNPHLIPHFFTILKQKGALLAKGRLLGIQFDELFKDNLYMHIGDTAIQYAQKITQTLKENGYPLYLETVTNQIFFYVDQPLLDRLSENVDLSFWEKADETHSIVRIAISWATQQKDVDALCNLLKEIKHDS